MTRKSKATPEGIAKRNRAFRHNSYKGYVTRMAMAANAIIQSDTTSVITKDIANKIANLCNDLRSSLETRID